MSERAFDLVPAKSDDCTRLLAMMEEFYLEEHLPFEPATAREAMVELLRTPALGTIFLLRVDGVEIGYLVAIRSFILEFGGRQTFLDEFYIRKEWRRRGFAREALTALEDIARGQGDRALRLEVARVNIRALEIYKCAGYECHDRFTMTKVLA